MRYFKIGILFIVLIIGIVILMPFFLSNNNYQNASINNSGSLKLEKVDSNNTITYNYRDYKNKIIYSWIFDKSEIEKFNNINLDMDFESEIEEQISNLDSDTKILSFSHQGLLPNNTWVKVYVNDKYNPNDKLNMYYYDADIELLRYKGSYVVDNDGYIVIDIEHCSDYILTGTIVQDAANNPKNMNVVIMVLIGIIILLVATSLFSSNKK